MAVGEDGVAIDGSWYGSDDAGVGIEASDGEKAGDDLRDAVTPPAVGVYVIDKADSFGRKSVVR